jgi:osmoprotectant transport system substrate-binding protein
VIVGSTNFYEQEILGELYAQELEHLGWQVEKKFQLGNREVVFPALRSGEIDVLPEYLASALTVAYQGEATTDAAETAELLAEAAEADDLVVLDFAEATNANGYVVTQETADQYGLGKVSDLANPAP